MITVLMVITVTLLASRVSERPADNATVTTILTPMLSATVTGKNYSDHRLFLSPISKHIEVNSNTVQKLMEA